MIKYILILLFVFFWCENVFPQNQVVVDSLLREVKKENKDIGIVDILNELSKQYWYNDAEKAEEYAKQALELATKIDYKKGVATSYKNSGIVHEIQGDFSKAIEYFEKSLEINIAINDLEEISSCHNSLGIVNDHQGNYNQAIKHYKKSLEVAEKLKDNQRIAYSLMNMGGAYMHKGDYAITTEYYHQALDLCEKDKDKEGMSYAYGNLGEVYRLQGNYSKAIEYFEKALKIDKELGEKYGMSLDLAYIGSVHELQNNFAKALEYFNESLKIAKELGDKAGIADCLNSMGGIYLKQKNYNKAKENFEEASVLSNEIGDKSGIAKSVFFLGDVNMNLGKYKEALEKFNEAVKLHEELGEESELVFDYIKMGETGLKMNDTEACIKYGSLSLKMAQDIGSMDNVRRAAKILAQCYAKREDYKNAYAYHILFKNAHDSIFTLESKKTISRMETKFELERKENQIKLQKTKLEKQKTTQNALIGGLVAVLIIVLLIFTGYFRIRKANVKIKEQNHEIEEKNEELNQINEELNATLETVNTQKEEIEVQHQKLFEQNKHITDSINYAKRIQQAILPARQIIEDVIPEHFILFRPRDIVSGDFYWMRKIGDYLFIAAADCTGHGVPGAFMSMLGVSFLNKIVREEDELTASQILDDLRHQVKITLGQTGKENEAKDGMDIAFCVINTKTNELQFSGANNPLYLIRRIELPQLYYTSEDIKRNKSIDDGKYRLTQIRANSQPIGVHIKEKPFSNNKIKLIDGDKIYIFSDGFADQIGGPKNKKFMTKRFKQLLLDIQNVPLAKQKLVLENNLTEWQNTAEQVDDILVVGMRI